MLTTTLSFANLHNHGELFANMLRARRELFIVHNKWNLPEAMGMEYDQYDTPASRWVVVHDAEGKVLAGNRLTPTTTRCGICSYMIRDAQRGLLDTIPAHLLYEEAPVADHVWESSRLFVSHDVPSSIRRRVWRMVAQSKQLPDFMSSLVQIKEVTKTFHRGSEDVPVLSGLDLTVEKGEFLALMGPSGSGKSTLLNLIGGLDRPTKGSVIIGDDRIDIKISFDIIKPFFINFLYVFFIFSIDQFHIRFIL